MAGEIFIASQESVDQVNTSLGKSTDAVNANTLWGKVKQLLTDWTTARAAKIDSIWDGITALIANPSRPYKQLKLNKVTSPIRKNSFIPYGIHFDWNSEYYLLVQGARVAKIRRSDGECVATISVGSNGTLPILEGDSLFYKNNANHGWLFVVDLVSMTSKYLLFPTNDTGAFQGLNSVDNFDVRVISGNQYQCVAYLSGATKSGVLVCSFDITSAQGTQMTKVSFNQLGAEPGNCSLKICFGTPQDTDQDAYYVYRNNATDPNISTVLTKYRTSTGVGLYDILPTSNDILTLENLDGFRPTNKFRFAQNSKYFVLGAIETQMYGQIDLMLCDKETGNAVYFSGIAYKSSYINQSTVPNKHIRLGTKRKDDVITLSDESTIIFIDSARKVTRIKKMIDMETPYYTSSASGIVFGMPDEYIVDFDLIAQKVVLATIVGLNDNYNRSASQREYDIV